MSSQRFAPEFKDEAVRQVIKRGHPVAEVARRLGVSVHSLYKRVKAARPGKNEQSANELVEAKSEILKLRAQLRRTEEERGILKKSRSVLCRGARVRYAFINDNGKEHGIATMCGVLDVAGSGFAEWLRKPLSDRAIEDLRLLDLIRAPRGVRAPLRCRGHVGRALSPGARLSGNFAAARSRGSFQVRDGRPLAQRCRLRVLSRAHCTGLRGARCALRKPDDGRDAARTVRGAGELTDATASHTGRRAAAIAARRGRGRGMSTAATICIVIERSRQGAAPEV